MDFDTWARQAHPFLFQDEGGLVSAETARKAAADAWNAADSKYELDSEGWLRVRGVCWEPAPNTINMQCYDADCTPVAYSTNGSADPRGDHHAMGAAKMLRDAIVLRNVDITPEVLYQHVVGRPYAGARAP